MTISAPLLVEHTPNPNTIKVLLGTRILTGPGVEFSDPASAASASPLAARLLRLDGVDRVYLGEDFLSVTQCGERNWRDLAPQVLAEIQEHAASGDVPLHEPDTRVAPTEASTSEASTRIQTILREEIQPAVARDGGDVRFIRYANQVLELEMRGACAGCPSSALTLRLGIEARLKEAVPELESIVARDG